MNQPLPLTYLFVPGNRPERFAKAMATDADVVIVDLEDAVSPEEKNAARIAFGQWFAALDQGRSRVALRINDAQSEWYRDDVVVAKHSSVPTVMLPKCESADQIVALLAELADFSGQGVRIIPLVESARGVLAVRSVAQAAGVARIAFGSIDFSVDMDLPLNAPALDHVSVEIAVASRAAGIASPITGVTTAIDAAVVAADMRIALGLGFGAKLCIHPSQIAAVRAAVAPSPPEIAWAQRVLEAAAGSGAVQVDGQMVDRPIILKARRILERR